MPTLVLDLDGTLVDTAGDLYRVLNTVLAEEGLAPVPRDKAVKMVGRGARVLLETAHKHHGVTPSENDLDRLTGRFIAHYSKDIASDSRLFDGALDSLERFGNDGWHLAICTNKLEGLARQLLQALDVDNRFAAIVGQDTFPYRKPDPRHIIETVKKAGGDPTSAVMVGDSEFDVDAAVAADIPVVAVSFGYSVDPVHTLGADAVIDHFDALYDTANRLLETRNRRG